MSNGSGQRRSIFGGLLLIVFGVLFLLHEFVPGWGLGHVFRRYWPLILILWGLARLYDNFIAQRSGQTRPPLVSGGEVALLLLLLFGVAVMATVDWVRRRNPDIDFSGDIFGGKPVSLSQELPAMPVKAGAHIAVSTDRGDISVHAGEGSEIRVVANKTVNTFSDEEGQKRLQQVALVANSVSDGYEIHPQHREEGSSDVRVDLDVQVPKQVSIVVKTERGDISVAGVSGPIAATDQNGDVEIHDVGGDVTANLQHGDVRVSAAHGNVRLTGHGSEVELADITGDVSIDGDFYGPVRVRNVAKTTHFTSSRTDLTIVQLSGRMESDSGKLEISDVPGSVNLTTREKDVTLDNVTGRIRLENRHGDIEVRFAEPPRGEVSIANDTGNVDVTLPSKSSFVISAASRSGEIQSDFSDPSLKLVNENETSKLDGTYGSRGPQIHLSTSYGTIYLRKAT